MRLWLALVAAGALLAACGDGELGEDCEENDDCEDGLVCAGADPGNDIEGVCANPGDGADTAL